MSELLNKPCCPKCEIIGNEYIVCEASTQASNGGDPWFETAFCAKCGHVYGVFAKVVISPRNSPLPGF
ncbi:TPA: hypothetical protein PXQ99_001203 [Yersinia enterocolitica]|nr:hypothetical protein [Yersinia enterocolitica]